MFNSRVMLKQFIRHLDDHYKDMKVIFKSFLIKYGDRRTFDFGWWTHDSIYKKIFLKKNHDIKVYIMKFKKKKFKN